MRIPYSVTKAAKTLSEYVTLIDFQHQQWLREHVSMLRLHMHRLSSYVHKWGC